MTNDEVDGPCIPGDCSLREAIIAANANPGPDDIVLTGGQVYTLTIAGTGENAAATGDLDITDTVAIFTPFGSGQATIQAGATPGSGIDRVFHINPTLANKFISVRFENLVIRHGTTTGDGGGILFDGVSPANLSQLRLTACRLEANQAATGGGGLWAKDLDTVFFLETFDAAIPAAQVAIRDNIVTAGDGGGMFINNCPMFINFQVTGVFANQASGNGGGLYYTGGASAGRTASLFGVFANNRADRDSNGSGDGGGIYISNTAAATLGQSQIGLGGNRGNRAVHGGGIANFGTLSITASGAAFAIFSDNQATLDGGGIYNSGASATVTATGNVVMQSNRADSDANSTGNGGGVFNNGGTFSMISPTMPAGSFLGQNRAFNGAGLATNGGTVTVSTASVVANNADNDGGGFWISGGTLTICEVILELNNANASGGAFFKSGGTLTANLSRVVSNFAANGSAIASSGGSSNVENNWWGCDDFPILQGNPNLAGCPTFTGTIDSNPRIDLRFIPTPTTIPPNGSSTLTADVTRNTDGVVLPFCNGPRPAPIVMEGRQVFFGLSGPTLGTINPTFGTITNGFATTKFTAGAATGTQDVSATIDIGTQLAQVVIASPVATSDLSLTKTVNNATPNVGQNITFT
ncbi:MAG TPA: hypothetical protein VN181_01505, partial [Thermoanaerobaculia bacterium]|nr:hypothetical protein [Thermoanaerobaculia bacterium]